MSETIKDLALALSKAQRMIKPAIKDQTNPFFKSSYADLASVWDAIREPLAANELAVVQIPTTRDDGKFVLITQLIHSSGQTIESIYPISPVKPDPQGIGSAITYARRYALQSMCGVCSEDDDGNQASFDGKGKQHPTNEKLNSKLDAAIEKVRPKPVQPEKVEPESVKPAEKDTRLVDWKAKAIEADPKEGEARFVKTFQASLANYRVQRFDQLSKTQQDAVVGQVRMVVETMLPMPGGAKKSKLAEKFEALATSASS